MSPSRPSTPFMISNMLPEIIAFEIGSVSSPFSILNALLASTEKSPEIGFAVCAPKTLVVKTPLLISLKSLFSLNLNSRFVGLIIGVEKYDPLSPFEVVLTPSQFAV